MAAAQTPAANNAALINMLAQLTHQSPQQVAAAMGGIQAQGGTSPTTYSGFNLSGNADTGQLFKGYGPAVWTTPWYQSTYARGTRVRYDLAGTQQHAAIQVAGLNLPPGWTAQFATQPGQYVGARAGQKMVHLNIINDKHQVVNSVMLTNQQVSEMDQIAYAPVGVLSPEQLQRNKEYQLQLTPDQLGAAAKTTQKELTGTIGDELKSLYGMATSQPQQLQAYKRELWAAGYYPSSMKLDQVDMNTITNDDITAFANLFEAASRYHEAGQPMTWQELLTRQAHSPSAAAAATSKGVKTYRLTDPNQTIVEANDVAQKVLGRGPSAEDVRNLVGMVEAHEQAKKAAIDAAQQSGDTTAFYQSTDPQADIEQYFRQKYPGEAQATDAADRIQVWQDLLKTPPTGGAPSEVQPR